MQVIQLPLSKSILIRKLFINYIYFNEIVQIKSKVPEDIKIVFRNLLLMRSVSQRKDNQLVTIDIKDCGAAFRFFTALLACTEGRWLLTGTERLLQRPIAPLVEALNSIGADIKKLENGFLICGKEILAEKIETDTTESSQFLTAILLISKKIGLKNIILKNDFRPSFSYVALTCEMLSRVGIETFMEKTGIGISYRNHQRMSFPDEADWSAAAFWYAAARLTERSFCLARLNANSAQPDRNIITIFEMFGVRTKAVPNGIFISPDSYAVKGKLRLDLRDNPDLAPVICAMTVLLRQPAEITGLETLNQKESKRLQVLQNELSLFADIAIIGGSTLEIAPAATFPEKESSLSFDSHNDHRMVMAFSLFNFFYDVEINGFSSVKKSYPEFKIQIDKILSLQSFNQMFNQNQ